MRVRVTCPVYWIMEIPSLGQAHPVMIGLLCWAPEHCSVARLTPNNTAEAAAATRLSQKVSLSWQLYCTQMFVCFFQVSYIGAAFTENIHKVWDSLQITFTIWKKNVNTMVKCFSVRVGVNQDYTYPWFGLLCFALSLAILYPRQEDRRLLHKNS